MKDLRERAARLAETIEKNNIDWTEAIESFAREMFDAGVSHGRNEALEEAATAIEELGEGGYLIRRIINADALAAQTNGKEVENG